MLGQVATVSTSGMQAIRTDYDSSSALPKATYSFGFLQRTLGYNADGTLASVKDGLNNTIALSSWYRGVPQTISYPTAVQQSALVNGDGTIASTTDELGYTSSYSYDAMGRLKKVTYPTGDTNYGGTAIAWNASNRTFAAVATAEYGLPAGHWTLTEQTGNGKTTTFFDAQWRPVLVLTQDSGNAASKSFVVNRYDTSGRVIFASYPVASLTSITDTLTGMSTTYDALGRPTQVRQDSELGVLTTTTDYLGFQTRVTNPRGYQTTTSFQVFDTPMPVDPC